MTHLQAGMIILITWCSLLVIYGMAVYCSQDTKEVAEAKRRKWRAQKIDEWSLRPLPTRVNAQEIEEYYLKRRDDYVDSPWLMIDAIANEKKEADEVIKWAIYYTLGSEAAFKDAEYRSYI